MASIRSAPRRQISSRARTNSWRASSVAATLSIGVPPFAGVTTPVSPINDRPEGTPRPSPGPASTTFVHTSAIITETVFNLQGLGLYSIQSVYRGDLPGVLAVTVLASLAIALMNLIVDVVYAFLDPLVRFA